MLKESASPTFDKSDGETMTFFGGRFRSFRQIHSDTRKLLPDAWRAAILIKKVLDACGITLDVYTQAVNWNKRAAQSKVVKMVDSSAGTKVANVGTTDSTKQAQNAG